MKIKSLLTLLLVATAALAFGQLPRIVLQPDGGGNPQVFLNFDDAIAAAESNDRIYLSGGAFQSNEQITLEFPIHIIGAGIHPDSTTVTNATTLTTANAIVITNGGSNSTFTGIKFISPALNNIQYGTSDDNDDPTGLYFERCEFQDRIDITTVNTPQQSNSESSFNECVFRDRITGATNANLTLTKCVFGNTSHVSAIDGGGLIIEHCVFFGNSIVLNSDGTTVRNTIFVSVPTPLYQCNGSAVINCTTQAAQFFGNSSGTVTNSFTNVENPFIDQSNSDYEYTDNLGVSSGSVASGGALDGTDMGLYGSAFPAKLGAVPYNPHFVAVEIAPSTDGDGNLPVTIKTQSQTY